MYAKRNTGSPRYLTRILNKPTIPPELKRIAGVCVILLALGGALQTAGAQTEANKAVIERWVEFWETADMTIADEILAPDFVGHIPHYPGASDLEGYKAEVAKGPTYVTDFDATIEDLIAEGDKVAGRFTAAGIMQPFNVTYTNTWIVIFRFVDGKIATCSASSSNSVRYRRRATRTPGASPRRSRATPAIRRRTRPASSA